MNLRNMRVYNQAKEVYYKYFHYRQYPHKWNKKNSYVSIFFEGKEYKLFLFKEKRKTHTKPFYNAEGLPFFWTELPGYIGKRKLKEGDYVLDIGASPGEFSIYAGKAVGENGKVFAFEPGDNTKIIQKNIEINGLKNVITVPKGVWKDEEILRFGGLGPGGHLDKSGNIEVPVTDVDSELNRRGIPYEKISFIKMDIEGAEIEALEGMKKLLKEGSPFLAIASYHIRDGEQTHKKVEEILRKSGYEVKTDYPKHLTTYAWKL